MECQISTNLIYLLSIIFFFCTVPGTFLASSTEQFQVVIEPQWVSLDDEMSLETNGVWVLVGSITFIKKAKESVRLDRIVLSWQGNPINELYGSLFKQGHHHTFLPIEDYVVSDGEWNKKRQQLTMNFEEQFTLGHTNTFYLVVSIPQTLEPVLKKGTFSVAHEYLPTPFKDHLKIQTVAMKK